MSIMKASWKNGEIVLEGHADWPEGCRLIVQEELPPGIIHSTEDKQRNDPEAIQRRVDDVRPIPPVPENPTPENPANAASLPEIIREAFPQAELGGEA